MIALNKLHDWYYIIVEDYLGVKKEHAAYFKQGLAVALIGLAAAGAWYGYRHYAMQTEQEALKVFNECYQEYEQALAGKSAWATVDTMCDAGYTRYRSTTIAPYIMAVRLEVLLAEQKLKEALELLPQMISRLNASSPLFNLYKTKFALLKMDMIDEATRAAGLKDLELLARDTKNLYNDVALYYLGLYYCMNNAVEKAKETWNQLVTLGSSPENQGQSPWALRAREKLQFI